MELIRKNLFWVCILAMTLLLGGLFVYSSWQTTSKSSSSNVEALGLRGTVRVSRPLSKTQAERLETHFLDIPAPSQAVMAPGTNRILSTVDQVDAINRLNERQSQ